MRSRTKATAAAMAGAVAIASAAYGIGTQAGGGTAAAENGNARERAAECGPPGLMLRFDGFAKELGVSEADLREALEDFREQVEGDHRNAFAAALAEALGKDASEVEDALDSIRPGGGDGGRRHPFVSLRRLAAELDVSRAELRDAFREVRSNMADDFEERHAELVEFLAERFNLSEDEVEKALPEPPDHPPGWRFERRGLGPGGPPPGFVPGGP